MVAPQKQSRRVREETPEAFVVGTGSAFGHHFSTKVLKECFRKQRIAAGDTVCDLGFADRVFDKCASSHHSICFEEKDIFRRMTRPEYLLHRATGIIEHNAKWVVFSVAASAGNLVQALAAMVQASAISSSDAAKTTASVQEASDEDAPGAPAAKLSKSKWRHFVDSAGSHREGRSSIDNFAQH